MTTSEWVRWREAAGQDGRVSLPEKVAVVGSRGYPDPVAAVSYFLANLSMECVIVTGGAPGIDRAAENFSRNIRKQEPIVIKAEWDGPSGKLAGKDRNWQIAWASDRMVAFWDGTSNGTAHAIAAMARIGRPVEVWMPGDS